MHTFIANFEKSLRKRFYTQSVETVARNLLGKVLVRKSRDGYLAAMITETEAYMGHGDGASHSAVGLTARNSAMFEEGGILYTYLIYGIHNCINVVSGKKGTGEAVLLRAAEPLAGMEQMMANRGVTKHEQLCKGPGNLAKAFLLGKDENFLSLLAPDLFIQKYSEVHNNNLFTSPRTGISKSSELMLRFCILGSPFVSGKNK